MISIQSFLVLPAVRFAYFMYVKNVSWLRQRRFERDHGCKRLRLGSQKDPIFGIDAFLEGSKAMREHIFLPYLTAIFEKYGSTFQWNLMGDNLIFTNEPKNLQAILATRFPDFGIRANAIADYETVLGSRHFQF